jgi:hypothetical protein
MTIFAVNVMVGLCSTFSAIFALWAMFYIPKLQRRFNAQLLASQEAQRVAESIRDTLQGQAPHLLKDARLSRLLAALAQSLPGYIAELPSLLAAKPVFPSIDGVAATPTYFLSGKLRDGGSLDELVRELNDPVLSMLWDIRTPSALCEMMRYGLDSAGGDVRVIAGWSHLGHAQDVARKHRALWNKWGAAN